MKIDKATLLHIDCMEFMAGLPDKAFDLAIVDPPYRDAKDNAPTKHLRAMDGDMRKWQNKPSKDYFAELFRVSKNQIIWGSNNFELPITNGILFWYKKQPMKNYSDGELAWTSFQVVARCFEYAYYGNINVDIDGRQHPTQKPVKLYEWLLNNYAKPGQRILDTHLGSGSSAIACNNLGYELVGCELDPDYYQAACKRVEQATKQIRMFA